MSILFSRSSLRSPEPDLSRVRANEQSLVEERADLSYLQRQMDKYGNIIVGFGEPVRIGFITDPSKGVHPRDRALGPLVVVAESDEREFLKRATEFGLRDFRLNFTKTHFYLAVVE